MSLISKEQFRLGLQSIKKLLSSKVDKSELKQADWNQDNNSQLDYIQNRTHYTYYETVLEDIFVFKHFYNSTWQMDLPQSGDIFTLKAFYRISIDNYVQICEYTGSTFQLPTAIGEMRLGRTTLLINFEDNIGDIYSTNVKVEKVQIKTLNEEYIPDSIARTIDLSNNIASLKRRPGRVFYGTCNSEPEISTKNVILYNGISDFVLQQGTIISVKFLKGNIYPNFSLSVEDGTAEEVTIGNSLNHNEAFFFDASANVVFLYSNNSWQIVSISPQVASTSYFGLTTLIDSVSSESTAAAATPSAVKQAYDLANQANNTAEMALPKSGGIMSGMLTLLDNPTEDAHAATKSYIDNEISAISQMPPCAEEDNGKFLRVSDGIATWQIVLNAEEVEF